MRADVLVVGGGPAGLATAIAARLKGLRVAVVDARKPPIDKACGEGLLPQAAAALCQLGIELDSRVAHPFTGIRFSDECSSVCAEFPTGSAFGVRRKVLHSLLAGRALDLGVSLRWGTRVLSLESDGAHTTAGFIPCKSLVGADGHSSSIRRLAGFDQRRGARFRLGFRRHYEQAPWSHLVEVHWGGNFQLVVTPTGPREICVSLFTADPRLRLENALSCLPDLARRLSSARPLSSEAGAVTMLSRARVVARRNIALVGDASCSVDGIAGQGLSLAFQQALHLADALVAGDLAPYVSAHRRIVRTPVRVTRLLLAMNASVTLRRKVFRVFAARPALFARMIAAHTGKSSTSAVESFGLLRLGWRVMWA